MMMMMMMMTMNYKFNQTLINNPTSPSGGVARWGVAGGFDRWRRSMTKAVGGLDPHDPCGI
jgi:hypothetical protein